MLKSTSYSTFIIIFIIPSVQRPPSTPSSSVVTLARPPTSSSLKITDLSFRYALITLSLEPTPFVSSWTLFWYQFLNFLLAVPIAFLFLFTALLSHNSISLSPGLKPTCFTNTTLLPRPPVWTAFTDYIVHCPDRFFSATWFFVFSFSQFFRSCSVRYID